MSLDLISMAAGMVPAVAASAAITRTVITNRASVDALTGVGTRERLPRLARAIRGAHRRGRQAAVVMCDMRDFKHINDTYGHDAGDAVLVATAQRLRDIDGVSDVVRLGGDEFAAVVTKRPADTVSGVARWRGLSYAIAHILEQPLRLDTGVVLRPQATLGTAIVGHGDTLPGLLTAADTAMYAARRENRSVHVIDGALTAPVTRPAERRRATHCPASAASVEVPAA